MPKKAPNEESLIVVQSTLEQNEDQTWPLAIYERATEHPGGEIFVKGEGQFKVAPTPAVVAAIQRGHLKVVKGDAPDQSEMLARGATNKGKGDDSDTGNTPKGTPLPEDTPARDVLAANKVTTVEQLNEAGPDKVKAFKGMNDAMFADLTSYGEKNFGSKK